MERRGSDEAGDDLKFLVPRTIVLNCGVGHLSIDTSISKGVVGLYEIATIKHLCVDAASVECLRYDKRGEALTKAHDVIECARAALTDQRYAVEKI